MIKSKQIPVASLVNLLIVNSDRCYPSQRFIRHSRFVKIFACRGSHLRAVCHVVFTDTLHDREEIFEINRDQAWRAFGEYMYRFWVRFRLHVHNRGIQFPRSDLSIHRIRELPAWGFRFYSSFSVPERLFRMHRNEGSRQQSVERFEMRAMRLYRAIDRCSGKPASASCVSRRDSRGNLLYAGGCSRCARFVVTVCQRQFHVFMERLILCTVLRSRLSLSINEFGIRRGSDGNFRHGRTRFPSREFRLSSFSMFESVSLCWLFAWALACFSVF